MIFELGSSSSSAANISRPSVNDLNSSTLAQIAEYVASTGETLNINDVNEWLKDKPIYHPQQQQLHSEGQPNGSSDELSAKTILCMPIINGQKTVIGVAQLINKVGTPKNILVAFFPTFLPSTRKTIYNLLAVIFPSSRRSPSSAGWAFTTPRCTRAPAS